MFGRAPKKSDNTKYYEALGVPKNASQDHLKKASEYSEEKCFEQWRRKWESSEHNKGVEGDVYGNEELEIKETAANIKSVENLKWHVFSIEHSEIRSIDDSICSYLGESLEEVGDQFENECAAVAAAAVVGGVREVVDRSVLNQKRWIAFLDRGYFWIAVEVAFCIDRFLERVADSKKMSTIRLDVEKFSGKKRSFQEGKKAQDLGYNKKGDEERRNRWRCRKYRLRMRRLLEELQQVEAWRRGASALLHSGKVVRVKKDGFDSRRGKEIHA
ncbi:hypothetical protein SASPL_101857 [Salvia splendens]|uniref:Uncharacterized protein n=1 Tax=Salvia splendens TaxID=180675 RepID=A0A8X8YVA8_SALSN|nr:hypothetical protein SASPL_101857 [Salvia splendens]